MRHEILFNTFTVREICLRRLLATGRTGLAVDLAESFTANSRRFSNSEGSSAVNWRVVGEFRASGSRTGWQGTVSSAIGASRMATVVLGWYLAGGGCRPADEGRPDGGAQRVSLRVGEFQRADEGSVSPGGV